MLCVLCMNCLCFWAFLFLCFVFLYIYFLFWSIIIEGFTMNFLLFSLFLSASIVVRRLIVSCFTFFHLLFFSIDWFRISSRSVDVCNVSIFVTKNKISWSWKKKNIVFDSALVQHVQSKIHLKYLFFSFSISESIFVGCLA